MKISEYKSYDELPLFLNAATVAKVLGVSPSSGYALMHVVGTSSASLASGQGRKLVRSTVPSLPTKPRDGFAGPLWVFPCSKSAAGWWCPRRNSWSGWSGTLEVMLIEEASSPHRLAQA